jgi:signal transduction histidine kinase
MPRKAKKIQFIFFIYWFLLVYIIAALVWWYIALSRQNDNMARFKIDDLHANDPAYVQKRNDIYDAQKRKQAQYIGEGSIFFLLIAAGAIFVYRSVRKEFNLNRQQQQFMMAVTHELKTPIAITRLNLETLQKRKLDETQQHKLLQNTLQEAHRMNALCNNMLMASQVESGLLHINSEPIELQELVERCVLDFKNRFPQKNIALDSAGELLVPGDPLLLQLAFNNLIDNAIKYGNTESGVRIELRPLKNQVECRIADSGPGIPDSEKLRVFDKYRRLGQPGSESVKGTGLGLYLTKKIIDGHDGKISVEDNQPKGAIFVVRLPASA